MADDLLECLLSAATEEEIPETSTVKASKTSFSDTLNSLSNTSYTVKNKKKLSLQLNNTSKSTSDLSTIHQGDTDSSDDEENRDFENRKYDESGKDVKHLLQTSIPSGSFPSGSFHSKINKTTWKTKTEPEKRKTQSSNPVFGIRVVNPLVSSKVLEERLVGREVVPMSRIKIFVRNVAPDKDWVVAGVIVHKSSTKTSQKGKNYCTFTLSDLKTDLKTVIIFFFGSAYKELWKTVTGTVIGILNPSVMELRDGSKDEACLSVDNHQRVMIIGQSKDLGICKSTRKNGERCTAFVNTSICEFCVYHVKQEYQKCSKRSELQSGFAGRGLVALRNKVLGKNQVFYAGKLYSAIPASKSRKQMAKDEGRLRALAGFPISSKVQGKTRKQKKAAQLELVAGQRQRDLERLRQLGISSEFNLDNRVKFDGLLSRDVTVKDAKILAMDVITKLKKSKCKGGTVDDNEEYLNNLQDTEDDSDGLQMPQKGFENHNSDGKKTSKQRDEDFEKELVKSCTRNSLKSQVPAMSQETPKQEENIEKNLGFKLIDSADNVDLNVDFKNFQKNFLKPQILTEKEISKSSLEGNETKCRFQLEQKMKKTFDDFIKSPDQKPSLASKVSSSDSTKNAFYDLQNTKANLLAKIPMLSGLRKSEIDLSVPIRQKRAARAKHNAVAWVQNNGPIKKEDPNNVRGSEKGKKRALDIINENDNAKKSKIKENGFFSERFKKMMAATSKHTDLLEGRDNEEQEKYFQKLEMKEQMEEKMLTTFKVSCKAVRCLKCKYTSFSASDMCKDEKHPFRVFDAMKRFFKCGNCGNRTVCLTLVPTTACNNCGSSKWEKTSMMKERKVEIAAPKLSIRGGEQKFVNSVIEDANLDLMVPDEL